MDPEIGQKTNFHAGVTYILFGKFSYFTLATPLAEEVMSASKTMFRVEDLISHDVLIRGQVQQRNHMDQVRQKTTWNVFIISPLLVILLNKTYVAYDKKYFFYFTYS